MMPHDDMEQDGQMIAEVLRKIADDMEGYEANRIHPKVEVMHLSEGSDGIPMPNENDAETPDQAEPENQDNQHEALDPKVLAELMQKAESSDEMGSTPDDALNEFPQEIQDAITKKRELHK